MDKSIPLTIICGFLGAGKTTLINHLLTEGFADKKVAVIVNDFGKVSLDDALIANATGDTMVLRNGCVCCTLAGDLTRGVERLLGDNAFDMVLLECSGITAVAPLLTLFDDHLSHLVYVDHVINLVNGAKFGRLVKVIVPVKEQVQMASHVILNRCDTINAAEIAEVKDVIGALNAQAAITETSFGKVSFEEITVGERVTKVAPTADVAHTKAWSTCTLSSVNIETLSQLNDLLKKIPSTVQRLKGFVTISSGETFCVQYVPNDLQITPWRDKIATDKQNLLTVIGTDGMIEAIKTLYGKTFDILN